MSLNFKVIKSKANVIPDRANILDPLNYKEIFQSTLLSFVNLHIR